MKKAVIFDPYLDTLGGGERYIFTFAKVLLANDYGVNIIWDDESIIQKAENRFGLGLKRVSILPKQRFLEKNLLKRFIFLRKYDLLFWVSDGSIPVMLSRKNILHFQVPFHNLNKKTHRFDKLKFKLINKVVCNSFFTKKIIDREYKIKSDVLYPPVDVEQFRPGKKGNIILAVGRFEETMQAKRQDVLIDVFKKMVDGGLTDWRLVLFGGSLTKEEDNSFLQKLKVQAQGYPIEFMVNASFGQLKQAYSQARIFWHAAGFGIDERKEPERVEHFGMTTIEAMAAGCWPLVYNAGGQREIFSSFIDKNLVLWKEKNELFEKTMRVINSLNKNILHYNELVNLYNNFRIDSFSKKDYEILQ